MSRAVTISDFHYTIIMAKRNHDNYVIARSIENMKNSLANELLKIRVQGGGERICSLN